jgi:hypothetical protein
VIDIPELQHLYTAADHVDVKSADSDVPLREFVAGMLNWHPVWLMALWVARAGLAKLLGLKHPPGSAHPRPEDIPFTPGAKIRFWTVAAAEEGRFIVLEASDTHLAAHLALVAEPGRRHAVTVVHYRNRVGPVYFAVVRPFHHLIVRAMVRAGCQNGSSG